MLKPEQRIHTIEGEARGTTKGIEASRSSKETSNQVSVLNSRIDL